RVRMEGVCNTPSTPGPRGADGVLHTPYTVDDAAGWLGFRPRTPESRADRYVRGTPAHARNEARQKRAFAVSVAIRKARSGMDANRCRARSCVPPNGRQRRCRRLARKCVPYKKLGRSTGGLPG